jgi:hypothetical protein
MSLGQPLAWVSFDGREFAAGGEGAGAPKDGGFEVARTPNGNGTSRKVLTAINGMMTDQVISYDINTDDQAFMVEMQAKAARGEDIDIAWGYPNNQIFSCSGNIEGELTFNPDTGTFSASWAWDGAADRQ